MIFGKAPVDVAELASAVIESFPLHATAPDQARFLRRALERLGTTHGYEVDCLRTDDSSFAINWWQPARGTVLAIGCDWGNAGDVASVFTSLMTVKAPMKVILFRTSELGAERADILQRTDLDAMRKAIAAAMLDFNQHVEGELYVLLEHVHAEGTFRAYYFVIPANGKLALTFEDAAHVFHPDEAAVTAQ